MDAAPNQELRKLPQVEALIEAIGGGVAHPLAADAARQAIEKARGSIRSGAAAPSLADLAGDALAMLEQDRRRRLVGVINATGVLLHTNLGRAPLGDAALRAITELGPGYSNLEYDLARGTRGSRYDHARDLIRSLTGAEDALVVNNNAAAVLLSLAALVPGRQVVISRGELIEIGGEFRIPDILAASGASLREVGTTNRTHLKDYRRALGPDTGAIMKVHPSNYRVVGFSASVEPGELAAVAREHGIWLIHDLGSGLLRRRIGGAERSWLAGEPTVVEAVSEGADVVCFSGDKLLGGPQAGIIAGRREALDRMFHHPLLRAFRVDKTTLAALEATLMAYLEGNESSLPLWQMALAPAAEIEVRAGAVASRLEGLPGEVSILPGSSTTGGGSMPGGKIPTSLLALATVSRSADDAARLLLDNDPPIVARIEEGRLILDLRTVRPADDAIVAGALARLR